MKYLCGFLLLTVTAVNSQLKWMKITNQGSVSPDGTRDCGFGYDAGRHQLILFGGRPGPKDETWIYNLTSDTWRMINSTLKPPPRFSFVSGIHGDSFYIAMGEGPSKTFYNDIWKFNLITEEWEEMPAQTRPSHISVSKWRELEALAYRPLSRYGAAGGIHSDGSHLIFHAGFADRRYFDTNSYDLNNPGWVVEHCPDGTCNPYNPSYPHARCLHGGTMVSADELAIFGGCLTGGSTLGPCPSGDSWIFNRQTSEWKRLDGCPSPKMYTTMAMLPSKGGHRRAVLYGGRERSKQVIETTDSGADEVAVLDPEMGIWTLQKTDTASEYPAKRLSSAMVTAPNGIYMFGGNDINKTEAVSDLWLLLGNAETAKNAQTIPCPKHFINYILLHGIFMVAGWGVFLTWGAIIARYFNSTGKLWFYMHVSFQVFGLILAIVGLAMGIKSVQFDHTKFTHAAIGAVVMVLGILQPCNAFIRPDRPKEGEPRSFKRKVWEFVHHFGGRIAILLALINISLGVFAAISKTVIWILWFSYVGVLFLVCIIAEYVKGCMSDQRLVKPKNDKAEKPEMVEHGESHNGHSLASPSYYKSSKIHPLEQEEQTVYEAQVPLENGVSAPVTTELSISQPPPVGETADAVERKKKPHGYKKKSKRSKKRRVKDDIIYSEEDIVHNDDVIYDDRMSSSTQDQEKSWLFKSRMEHKQKLPPLELKKNPTVKYMPGLRQSHSEQDTVSKRDSTSKSDESRNERDSRSVRSRSDDTDSQNLTNESKSDIHCDSKSDTVGAKSGESATNLTSTSVDRISTGNSVESDSYMTTQDNTTSHRDKDETS